MQKCGKFQDVEDFDEDRKSCRGSLMRHSLQQRATRERRAHRIAEEAAKVQDDQEEGAETEHIMEEVGQDSATPHEDAKEEAPQLWSPSPPLRAIGSAVSVVERFDDAVSVIPSHERSLMMVKPSAPPPAVPPPSTGLYSQVSDADRLMVTIDKMSSIKTPGMVPVGDSATATMHLPSAALPASVVGSAFTGVASMDVLSVVTDVFDIDAALAAVEASLAAGTSVDGDASMPVAPVGSPATSPALTGMEYAIPADFFAAARPTFNEDAAMAPTFAADWGFTAEGTDTLAPVLDLPRFN